MLCLVAIVAQVVAQSETPEIEMIVDSPVGTNELTTPSKKVGMNALFQLPMKVKMKVESKKTRLSLTGKKTNKVKEALAKMSARAQAIIAIYKCKKNKKCWARHVANRAKRERAAKSKLKDTTIAGLKRLCFKHKKCRQCLSSKRCRDRLIKKYRQCLLSKRCRDRLIEKIKAGAAKRKAKKAVAAKKAKKNGNHRHHRRRHRYRRRHHRHHRRRHRYRH